MYEDMIDKTIISTTPIMTNSISRNVIILKIFDRLSLKTINTAVKLAPVIIIAFITIVPVNGIKKGAEQDIRNPIKSIITFFVVKRGSLFKKGKS